LVDNLLVGRRLRAMKEGERLPALSRWNFFSGPEFGYGNSLLQEFSERAAACIRRAEGRGIVFIGTRGEVYCYVAPGGV
jgi:hypothetical protein